MAGTGGAGLVDGWSTTWRLTWAPVPGALAYAVHLLGIEGADPVPHLVAEPVWEIEVACGPDPQSVSSFDPQFGLQLDPQPGPHFGSHSNPQSGSRSSPQVGPQPGHPPSERMAHRIDRQIRADQLAQVASSLQVCVVACFADAVGPPSELLTVGLAV